MDANLWADRGQLLQLDQGGNDCRTLGFGVSRLATVRAPARQASIWIQLRGRSWIESREGRFHLSRGEWIAFAPDSCPVTQADTRGLCLGLSLGTRLRQVMVHRGDGALFAGRGHADHAELRRFVRLWRLAGARLAALQPTDGKDEFDALRPLLLHLSSIQRELVSRLARCPGRSRIRKRQVFARLQRARLYLEGNCDRVVSLGELAELTSFSSWYFSKTFHGLYDESPQAACRRLRLERAAVLLAGSPLLVAEVGAACGFDNACSFARAFRSHHGMSASSYRDIARVRVSAAARPDPAKATGMGRKASWVIGP